MPKAKNPKGGRRKPKEIRDLVIQIAKTTGFETLKMDQIEVKSYVGGLVNSFERKAA